MAKHFGWRFRSVALLSGVFLLQMLMPGPGMAEDPPLGLTPPSAYEEDRNKDLIPDLEPLEPAYLPWGPNTSGPNFTGTAEVEPVGSFFIEPYWFDYIQPGLGFSSLSMPERISIGLMENWEFDMSIPFVSNHGSAPTTPVGQSINSFGMGDTLLWVKRQLTSDADVYHFLARPAITIEGQFTLPTGHFLNLNPQLYGVDQTGDGTYNEGLYVIVRKHFKPFMFYLQVGDIIENPTDVGPGFTFNNGLSVTSSSQSVLNGNLLYYAGALEHVLNDKWGAGYVLEFFGESQSGQSLFGAANAPAWSFFWIDPAIEFSWPNEGAVTVTWGAGIALPVYQSNYPQTFTPLGTVTIYYNGPFGYRGE
ncbi:MAG: hypothetical protein ACYCXP_11060 [Leptospirillum sp.]|jgi:hypothetical protein|nr:hypothetical protein [Nitrospiraceae bacterium]